MADPRFKRWVRLHTSESESQTFDVVNLWLKRGLLTHADFAAEDTLADQLQALVRAHPGLRAFDQRRMSPAVSERWDQLSEEVLAYLATLQSTTVKAGAAAATRYFRFRHFLDPERPLPRLVAVARALSAVSRLLQQNRVLLVVLHPYHALTWYNRIVTALNRRRPGVEAAFAEYQRLGRTSVAAKTFFAVELVPFVALSLVLADEPLGARALCHAQWSAGTSPAQAWRFADQTFHRRVDVTAVMHRAGRQVATTAVERPLCLAVQGHVAALYLARPRTSQETPYVFSGIRGGAWTRPVQRLLPYLRELLGDTALPEWLGRAQSLMYNLSLLWLAAQAARHGLARVARTFAAANRAGLALASSRSARSDKWYNQAYLTRRYLAAAESLDLKLPPWGHHVVPLEPWSTAPDLLAAVTFPPTVPPRFRARRGSPQARPRRRSRRSRRASPLLRAATQ